MYKKLKELREEKEYTMKDLAKVIDKSEANYCKKENGDVKFSVSEALKIAEHFNCKVEDIFSNEDLEK